jgi:hypothetical protein
MTMLCPDCNANTLHVQRSLELPPDGYNDKIRLQLVGCTTCGLEALAVYKETRRGSLDAESWQHEGLRVSETDFQTVAAAIQRCPRPLDKQCSCLTHQTLGQTSGYSWDGLRKTGVKIRAVFDVHK